MSKKPYNSSSTSRVGGTSNLQPNHLHPSEEEGDEISLTVSDLRSNTAIPAMANSTDDYTAFREWEESVISDKTCRGRAYYLMYLLWGALSMLEPLWQAGLTILVSVGVMYSSTLQDGNLFKGMLLGSFTGGVTALVLMGMWWFTFHTGAFTDSRSKLRYRNAYSAGTIVVYCIVVVLFVVVLFLLTAVEKHCVPKDLISGVMCDFKCDILSGLKGEGGGGGGEVGGG
jgi:hypothetical protein